MPSSLNFTTTLLLLTVVLVILPTETYAFGAGDIPDFAYLSDKAFRHGDIENILSEVVKHAGRAAGGGGLLGFAKQVLDSTSGGAKFNKGDIKKVYFGNWLRDYSQAMDIAGLSKLTADTLVLVVAVLGFMTFGFATEEFEVTADRLGVYLPVEHIDNPKGYAEKEGDARQFHPKLRPPVEDVELEIDERTGMKKYMATEDGGFDSSTAHIRRVFRSCIEYGRRAGGREGADLWEAYRLLGTGLHTMEDLLAHSNWCEIALRKMGHSEVFCHVGDQVEIETPNGRAPPLVTGTFGSADFLHSLLGEATDHISQASVTALSDKMNDSKNEDASSKISQLKDLFGKFGGSGDDDKMSQAEAMEQKSKAYDFNPDEVAPPEVQKQLLDLLKWRDNVYRDILKKIEMVPGLSDLLDELTNALNAYVYTVLAPWLTATTNVLGEGSKAVIDSDDQYRVFEDPNASDPSHSLLSKDHFGLILNEPAGKIAQIVVIHTVRLIVQAWADDSNSDEVINQVLEAFHHPYYATGNSQIQHQMFEEMQKWFGGLGPDEDERTIQALTKESVREGKNKRLNEEGEGQIEPGYGGSKHTSGGYGSGGGYSSGGDRQQGYGQDSSYSSGRHQESQYGGSSGYGRDSGGYGFSRHEQQSSYGSRNDDGDGYNGGRRHEETAYGGRNDDEGEYNSGRRQEYGGSGVYGGGSEGYGSGRHEQSSYGGRNEYGSSGDSYQQQSSYGGGGHGYGRESYGGREESYGSGRNENSYSSYGGRNNESHDSGRNESSYGGRDDDTHGSRRNEESYNTSYGSSRNQGSYGYSRDEDSYETSRNDSVGYGRNEADNSYGSDRSGYNPSYGRSERSEEHGSGGGRGYGGGAEYGSSSGYDGGESRQDGYNPSYGGDSGDTFGAERMNIRDDNEYGGSGGYEERSYGRRREYDEGY
ncbi:heterokaryon incompatibility protein het-c [Moniliophthora roreri]|uniref:Putative Het-C-domain-containing protein n=1 Tax=Moniliophthora roreri TaxID=221103 RepID=A0A0W0FRQ4_MONRR|nr:heterokaryon incompatibility protein het-c [Moniliophthora roreri]